MTKAARKAAAPDSTPASTPDSTPSNLTDIGQCWVLPLTDHTDGRGVTTPDFAPSSIQRFKDRDDTTMLVVAVDGVLHKTPA